ncbi:MAG TPA: succinyl-diaminopimelate desuccinylase, partial [Acidimicrobiia bacterium]|nr:succinyl-diaminopimelate desuccinylase [Acidimicrobiia bacterium]
STASLPDLLAAPADDLLTLTAALVAVDSVSRHEQELADRVERRLAERAPGLALARVGNNVIVRTELGRDRRVVLGGHLDTVPPNANEAPRLDGDVLHGLGSADMKGGLAVLLRLAEDIAGGREPRVDCTLFFYEGEEIAEEFNGLRRVFADRPELLAGDFAILLEPTGGHVEAGCQGTLHLRAHFDGERAHSARPWQGSNAIHAAAEALHRLAGHESDTVTVDGLSYRESLQVVRIEGGVANNVVPDSCTIVVNRRFAPRYSVEEAQAQVEKLLAGADRIEVVNASPAAPPNLDHPLVGEFVESLGVDVEPKLGWTDVARFASRGVPAVNFGPGDPDVAHTADEHVTRASVEQCYAALGRFVGLAA